MGYEGLYEVSNLGNVRNSRKNKLLKKSNNYAGYSVVTLFSNEYRKQFRVGRLVASSFIPNPNNKPFIDHINTIKSDDNIENLRWCTQYENMSNPITRKHISDAVKGELNHNYGIIYNDEYKKRMSERLKGRKVSEDTKRKMREKHPRKRRIKQYDFNGTLIGEWESMLAVKRATGISNSKICWCCKGYIKTAGGYIWRYADADE